MKIFISQPLFENSIEEILNKRQHVLEILWTEFDKNIEVIDCFQEFSKTMNPIYYLQKNLQQLQQSDLIYFAKDWQKSKNCQLEHECALLYNLKIKYEDNFIYKKCKGTVSIFYKDNKLQINGINCTNDVLLTFSQFQPLIISSSINKNKSINFHLYVLNKYQNLLLSTTFQEQCKNNGIILNVNEEEILKNINLDNKMKEILKGEKMFENSINQNEVIL